MLETWSVKALGFLEPYRKIDDEEECVLTSPFMKHISVRKALLSQQIVPAFTQKKKPLKSTKFQKSNGTPFSNCLYHLIKNSFHEECTVWMQRIQRNLSWLFIFGEKINMKQKNRKSSSFPSFYEQNWGEKAINSQTTISFRGSSYYVEGKKSSNKPPKKAK